MDAAEDCMYRSISGITVYYVQLISWGVFFVMFGAGIVKDTLRGRWGQQFTLTLFGVWLAIWQGLLYILQFALNVQRVDPFCTRSTLLVFPSIPSFYAAAGATFIMAFVQVQGLDLPWSKWPVLLVFLLCPFVLAFFTINTWIEVLVSILVGVASTMLFFVILVRWLIPWYPHLLNSFPWAYMYCIDTWFMTERSRQQEDDIRDVIKRLPRQYISCIPPHTGCARDSCRMTHLRRDKSRSNCRSHRCRRHQSRPHTLHSAQWCARLRLQMQPLTL